MLLSQGSRGGTNKLEGVLSSCTMTSTTEDRLVWPPVLKIQVSPSSMLTEAKNHLKAQFAAQKHAFKAAKFLKVGDAPILTYIYCFPPRHESFAIAQVIHKHFEESGLGRGVKLSMTTGYTCYLANVRDLKKIDPDKKLVKGWNVVIGSQNAVIDPFTDVPNVTAAGSKPSTKDSEAPVSSGKSNSWLQGFRVQGSGFCEIFFANQSLSGFCTNSMPRLFLSYCTPFEHMIFEEPDLLRIFII